MWVDRETDLSELVSGDGSLDIQLIGRLRLAWAQYALLALVVLLVGTIAFSGYQSSRIVTARTSALNKQLQLVSGNTVSPERQILTHALVADRWAGGEASDEELELSRALVERQLSIVANDADSDRRLGAKMDTLETALAEVDRLVAGGGAPVGPTEGSELAVAIDVMVTAAKRLFDVTEQTNFDLVHTLQDSLRGSRQTQWVMAASIVLLISGLVVSLKRMLRSNFVTAEQALQREHERYEAVRRAQVRVEHRYREVVDQVNDVVFRADDGGHWTLLNGAWVHLSGSPVDTALGRSVAEIFHPDDRHQVTACFADLILGTSSHVTLQLRVVRPAGVERVVVVSAQAAYGDDNERAFVAGTMNDVTARVRAEQLTSAQTEILEMVALDVPLDEVLDSVVARIEPHLPGTRLRFSRPPDPVPSPTPESENRGIVALSVFATGRGPVPWSGNRTVAPVAVMTSRVLS